MTRELLNLKSIIMALALMLGPFFYVDEIKASENHNDQELEELIKYYQENSEKIVPKEVQEKLQRGEEISIEDIQKNINLKDVQEIVQKQMKQVSKVFSSKDPRVIQKDISDNIFNKTGIRISENNPLIRFTRGMMQDSDALPDMMGMFKDRKKLFQFALVNIGILVFGFFLRSFILRSDGGFFNSINKAFTRFVIVNGLRIGVLVYFYGNELNATWVVFTREFIS